jgi:hypothetical protein
LGVGFTVIVNVCGVPGHPAADGVTVIVAVIGVLVVLTAVKAGIFPLPLATKPIEVLLFVQLKIEPVTDPVNVIAFVVAPLHRIWLAGCTTLGVGFTVIVNVLGAPGQPDAEGVTVIVAVTGVLLLLMAVKAGIFPLPLAAKPIEVLLFVQLNVEPLTEPVYATAAVEAPLHNIWFEGCTTLGVGFTVIVNICGGPVQPFADGVTVIVAITGTVPVLIAVKAGIFPIPLAANPIEGLLFVQLNAVPLTEPVNVMAFVVAPLHKLWFAGCTTLGIGLITTLYVAVPLHPPGTLTLSCTRYEPGDKKVCVTVSPIAVLPSPKSQKVVRDGRFLL